MPTNNAPSRLWTLLALIAGIVWTLFINGAVPWVATPTLGQAASMLGYAQSFADQHWYTIHARSFGFPVPAALATGLPLAVVAGWFLRVGMAPADAYSVAAAVWLTAGFLGAWFLARRLGVRSWVAAFAAAAWTSMPMVWAHQGYSSLAMGMAMLPLYLWSAYRIFDVLNAATWRVRVSNPLVFIGLCIVSVFMDGYTFMMFAVAAAFGYAFHLACFSNFRVRDACIVTPIFLIGFAAAYTLYSAFIGRSSFEPASLDSFRGWGVDLTFLAKPTAKELWIWDFVGWTRERSQQRFYGDASVWTTTFALPMIVAGLGCMLSQKIRDRRIWPWLMILTFGIYMAMGPTIKVGAIKPAGASDLTMPERVGSVSTGNATLSEHLPGFRNMRAAYRWEALFLIGLWAIVALRSGRGTASRDIAWALVYVAIIVLSIADPRLKWGDYTSFHRDLERMNRGIAMPLAAELEAGSLVLFLPWTNDIVASYVASAAHLVTYNVSGDKQLDITRAAWPARIAAFPLGHFDANDATSIRNLLLEHQADAVIVPYFDGFNGGLVWPCANDARGYSSYQLSLVAPLSLPCPAQLRAAYAGGVAALRADDLVKVDEQPWFAIIRLRAEYVGRSGHERALATLAAHVILPVDIGADHESTERILYDGWYASDSATHWSMANASLLLPVPDVCGDRGCKAKLTFSGFGASLNRPLSVTAKVKGAANVASITLSDEAAHAIEIALPAHMPFVELQLDIPQASSPAALGVSSDARVLGISLSRVEINVAEPELLKRSPQ